MSKLFDFIKQEYPSAELVADEANGENSVKFMQYRTIIDSVCVAIKNGDTIDIYDDKGHRFYGIFIGEKGDGKLYSLDMDYLNSHGYFEKIKDYMEKEYGGEPGDIFVREEHTFNLSMDRTESYRAALGIHIHYKDRPYDIKSFLINYNYDIDREKGNVTEYFEAYKKSDCVYFQSYRGPFSVKHD